MKKIQLLILILVGFAPFAYSQVILTGSTGRAVEFAGLKDATPKGITAQMTERDKKIIGIPWTKLDLKALEKDHNKIYLAYLAAKEGETIPLNLGIFEDPVEKERKLTEAETKKKNGWYETSVSGINFKIQLPVGTPRGVLLVAHDDRGNSNRMIMGMAQGAGKWGEFQNRHRFALMTYFYTTKMKGPKDIDDFVYADKGSGQAVLDALAKVAKEAKKLEIAELPIAIYGFDKIGAAFAYNFTMWKPERVVAATVSKGAFYKAVPTEESVKVPMLLAYGAYDNTAELWGSDRGHEVIFNEYRSMNPYWVYASEFRGKNGDTPESDHIAQNFLHAMIEARVPKPEPKKAPPPKPEEKPAEGEDKPTPSEEEPEPEPEPENLVPPLLPFDQSKSYVGNLDTLEYMPMKKDTGGEIEEGFTWLPSRDFGRLWKEFAEGTMDLNLGEGQ